MFTIYCVVHNTAHAQLKSLKIGYCVLTTPISYFLLLARYVPNVAKSSI